MLFDGSPRGQHPRIYVPCWSLCNCCRARTGRRVFASNTQVLRVNFDLRLELCSISKNRNKTDDGIKVNIVLQDHGPISYLTIDPKWQRLTSWWEQRRSGQRAALPAESAYLGLGGPAPAKKRRPPPKKGNRKGIKDEAVRLERRSSPVNPLNLRKEPD